MNNLGIYIVILALVSILLLLYLLVMICAKKFECFRKLLNLLKRYMFYQIPLRYVIVGYLRLMSIFSSIFLIGVSENN